MHALKSAFKSMNRREIIITIALLFLIGLLLVYGIHLICDFYRGAYDPQDTPPDAVHLLTSLELAAVSALGVSCDYAILCYWLLAIVTITVVIIVWYHVIYLPVHRAVFFIDEFSPSYTVDGDLVQHQPASPERHKPSKAHPQLHHGIYRRPSQPHRSHHPH